MIKANSKINGPVYQIDVQESGQPLPQPKQCPSNFECLNGGTCIYDILIGPKCVCRPGFLGDNCNQCRFFYDLFNFKIYLFKTSIY